MRFHAVNHQKNKNKIKKKSKHVFTEEHFWSSKFKRSQLHGGGKNDESVEAGEPRGRERRDDEEEDEEKQRTKNCSS